ncbi:gliding motility-associated C-terminal domain-containing protein [Hymenobacter sp. BT664]|uniref:Gliding motility-associated C-terminal domain-containing protein n=1 Tax=Hymenobacter montanus TaxID=2771359 RepID=A0A927BHH8_9BACT|nr:gliding motility-associated C-terminal domain-containing protein [Hymenobacter montanus]MBD2770102.1 gliding motility-associated C-terminal domain-containing protein [Hymenobacter montanus]
MLVLLRTFCRLFLALLVCPTLLLAQSRPASPASAPPGTASLEFIPNQGQWDDRVRYEAALPAGRLFVLLHALTYAFLDPAILSHHHGAAQGGAPAAGAATGIAAHAYTVHFERASPQVRLTAETPTAGERNYFVGNDARRWARHVGAFRRVRYTSLWTGIDLTLYENAQQHLEYDVLLAPHANPDRIALRYDGATSLALDAAGNLTVKTSVGTTTEQAPRAWQLDAAGQRQAVACQYVLTGSTLRFALGAYDPARALTIDPTVQFSTLTGSTADNWGFTATYDNAGNLYSGGIVFDTGGSYPATPGAYRTTFSSVVDMAIIKYNARATGPAARVWATYLGGNGSDFPHSLVVNAQNELVILGSTGSTNYPTSSSAAQRSFRGGSPLDPFRANRAPYDVPNGSDLVISRLSANGSALVASTYLGGSGNDGVVAPSTVRANYGDAFRSDVLLDGAGNVYVASATSSANFPGLSAGRGATYRGGTSDAVVCKLTPNLDAVLWANLLGGTDTDAAYSIQRDSQGRVYVCGASVQLDANQPNGFPVTPNAYSSSFQGGGIDGFAARISADGRALERATFIGTSGYDQAQFLQLDATGNVYLFGQTLGAFPITPGRYGTVGGSLFIQKLTPDLTASLYSTTFGNRAGAYGGPNLVPTAFLVDECERVYISGWGGEDNDLGAWLGGTTTGLPVTANAVQTATDGSDFYLAQFAAGMTGLEYATFFGQQGNAPEHVDGGTSRFDKRGIVYQAVCASCGGSQGFPVPPGAGSYTTRNGSSNCNNGAFKINFELIQADPGPARWVCVTDGPVTLGGTPAGGVWSGPGVQPGPSGGYHFVPAAVGPGQYFIRYAVAGTGTCISTRTVRYLVAPAVVPVFAPVPSQCSTGAAVALTATPAGGTFTGPGVTGSQFDPTRAGVGTHTLTYSLSDSLGCGVVSQRVTVEQAPTIRLRPDTTLCADQQQPFQLRGSSPAGGTWSGPGVTGSGFFTPPNTNNRGGIFTLTYTVIQGPCRVSATRTVVIAPTASQNVSLNLPVCAAQPQYGGLAPFECPLSPVLLDPNATYRWDFGDGSQPSSEAQPTHRYLQAGSYRIRLVARYGNCEVITGFAPLEIGDVFVPNIITPNGDDQNPTFQPRFSCRPTSLEVFTRWGQRVYQTDDYHNTWDAQGLPDGIYYYLLRDADDRRAKGWIEVRR